MTLVKICGVRTIADALAAADAGADWLGLNFYAPSPRSITIDRARAIADALRGRVRLAGVFVGGAASEVAGVAETLQLDAVQWHGPLAPEDWAGARGFFRIRAVALRNARAIAGALEGLDPPDALLVDGWAPGQHGGTGVTVPPELLQSIPPAARLILAGGLNPENVADRAALARPWMVDVASGVESAPGVKDPGLMQRFVRAAKSAAG